MVESEMQQEDQATERTGFSAVVLVSRGSMGTKSPRHSHTNLSCELCISDSKTWSNAGFAPP
uniref:Uncharacterized protein n=1 Tax=Anguilla anguilla TaxID=7936 RepID=A0A0E9WJ25_ANGAN